MARQPDDANIQGKILSAVLCAVSGLIRSLEDFLLHFQVAERPAALVACVGRPSRYPVVASFTVFRQASADVPPITKATW